MLADCLQVLCKNGFSPSADDVRKLVKEYLDQNSITTRFTGNLPGRHWLRNFMDRNDLSLKKANLISTARKSNTSNPFSIFGIFDLLEEVVKKYDLEPA